MPARSCRTWGQSGRAQVGYYQETAGHNQLLWAVSSGEIRLQLRGPAQRLEMTRRKTIRLRPLCRTSRSPARGIMCFTSFTSSRQLTRPSRLLSKEEKADVNLGSFAETKPAMRSRALSARSLEVPAKERHSLNASKSSSYVVCPSPSSWEGMGGKR